MSRFPDALRCLEALVGRPEHTLPPGASEAAPETVERMHGRLAHGLRAFYTSPKGAVLFHRLVSFHDVDAVTASSERTGHLLHARRRLTR